jgi:hypothetical protein
VKEVTAQWWELSKNFAVIASLAGQQQKASIYANQALALLKSVTKHKPNKAVVAALQAFVSEDTASKPAQLIGNRNRSAVIFLTTEPLPVIAPNEGTNDDSGKVRTTATNNIDLFELLRRITGPVSALEAVRLSGLPSKGRLVLALPLEILRSPALPKLISESLDPSETVIYTRAEAEAVEALQKNYPGARVHPEGTLTPEEIRKLEISPM